jgi:hypothetical protein
MAKIAKKMSTGKKVAIGVGAAAVIGAILCYFYCPCFKKKAAGGAVGADGFASYGAEASGAESGPPGGGGIGWSGPVQHKVNVPLRVPAPLHVEGVEQQLMAQRSGIHYNVPIL